jgi:hypothetical protein
MHCRLCDTFKQTAEVTKELHWNHKAGHLLELIFGQSHEWMPKHWHALHRSYDFVTFLDAHVRQLGR